jgi:hypothetical protein
MKTWEEMRAAVNAREGSIEHRILADIEKGVAAGTPFTVQRATYGAAAASNLQIWEVVVLQLRAGGWRVAETDEAVTVEGREAPPG